MSIPEVTAFYAGILGLMAIGLGATAGLYRAKHDIALGDGGDQELLLRMRRHANFAENVPLALILFALLEMQGVSSMVSYSLGTALVVGRILHWVGFSDNARSPTRGLGAGLTTLSIAVAAVWNIVRSF